MREWREKFGLIASSTLKLSLPTVNVTQNYHFDLPLCRFKHRTRAVFYLCIACFMLNKGKITFCNVRKNNLSNTMFLTCAIEALNECNRKTKIDTE